MILNKFANLSFRSKVKATIAILGKKTLSWFQPFFVWTNYDIASHKYDNIWDKYAFQHCRS